jgi:hypothetical protein
MPLEFRGRKLLLRERLQLMPSPAKLKGLCILQTPESMRQLVISFSSSFSSSDFMEQALAYGG